MALPAGEDVRARLEGTAGVARATRSCPPTWTSRERWTPSGAAPPSLL